MSRLIDADKALEIVHNQGIAHPNAYHLTNYATLILQEAPTVDAVEVVRHGRWESNGIPDSMLSACSVCGFGCGAYSFQYCPNCGAKMDGNDNA